MARLLAEIVIVVVRGVLLQHYRNTQFTWAITIFQKMYPWKWLYMDMKILLKNWSIGKATKAILSIGCEIEVATIHSVNWTHVDLILWVSLATLTSIPLSIRSQNCGAQENPEPFVRPWTYNTAMHSHGTNALPSQIWFALLLNCCHMTNAWVLVFYFIIFLLFSGNNFSEVLFNSLCFEWH